MKEYFDFSKINKADDTYYIKKSPKGFGRFAHHIKFVLSEYSDLKIDNIICDTDAVTIICEMNNKIRHIIIPNYAVEEITFRLEHDRYCDDSTIDWFDTHLKLKILEVFYATKIDNQDS